MNGFLVLFAAATAVVLFPGLLPALERLAERVLTFDPWRLK